MTEREYLMSFYLKVRLLYLTFELRDSLGIPRPAPSALKIFTLGAGLEIPSEPRSSKVRLIVLLSNRMTSGIHALHLAAPSGIGLSDGNEYTTNFLNQNILYKLLIYYHILHT